MTDIEESWLISLVEERPVIWDKRLEEYKNKARTFEAWREICAILNEDFANLTNGEKILYGKSLTKRWNSLRDAWMKCHKKLLNKSAQEAKNIKKYVFYDKMIFLSQIVSPRDNSNDSNAVNNTCEDLSDTSEDEEVEYYDIQTTSKKKRVEPIKAVNVLFKDEENDSIEPPNKKKKIEIELSQIKDYISSEVDIRLLKFINSVQEKEKISPIMSFFKGIEPTVAKFNDTDLVEFQYEVLRIVRSIQQKNYLMK